MQKKGFPRKIGETRVDFPHLKVYRRVIDQNWTMGTRGFPQEFTIPDPSCRGDLRLEPKGSTAAVSETETAGGASHGVAGGIAMV